MMVMTKIRDGGRHYHDHALLWVGGGCAANTENAADCTLRTTRGACSQRQFTCLALGREEEQEKCGATVTAFYSGKSENGDVDRLPRGVPRDSRGKAFKCQDTM